ncbi:protein-L-isoaspartate O-methyltransferase [Pseudothermotoga sp. U03pept]|uniref:protein-L-isoaspartate O-methyltransferase n=1 Tax=Pseudothermotoga sp. U03pept TaxID=3447012 RepID=UPI003F02F646
MFANSWRSELVRQILLTGQYDKDILEAFEKVPREIFCEYDYPPEVLYSDDVVVTSKDKEDQSTSSQPSLMALFMKVVDLRKDMKVLEIGSGTGYNACVMAQVVGENGLIVGLEYNKKFSEAAMLAVHKLGVKNVVFLNEDGAVGCEEFSPYDAIVVTVAVDVIPLTWLRQLKDGGRIIAPIDIACVNSQPAILFERSSGFVHASEVIETRFLKAKGLLGQLNQKNLERLSALYPKGFSGSVRVRDFFEAEIFRILHLTCWSLCKKEQKIYHVEENGYAVYNGEWELFGAVEKLPKVLERWKELGFADLRNLQITYDESMNFLQMNSIRRGR